MKLQSETEESTYRERFVQSLHDRGGVVGRSVFQTDEVGSELLQQQKLAGQLVGEAVGDGVAGRRNHLGDSLDLQKKKTGILVNIIDCLSDIK